ncbi:hypothetical protein SEVIR_7G246500v4 [Setaria viridis]|nr:uncharacterized protein LOC101777788 isoform X2 [Setaria italica]XP_034605595.1 uncharacterized protein LOC117865487 isoform X2 [Setaria viridis]
MFYIDPVNGYEFRSLKDVYRYLESGDISQCVTLPNKRKIEDLHTAGDQSDHTGKPSDHTQPDTDVESNEYHIPRGTNTLRNVQREAVRVEASESESIQSGLIEHTPGKAESVTRTGANAEQRPKEKKRKTKPVKGIATPLRSSPRLAALKISQEANNSAPRDELISTNSDITNQSQPKQAQKPRRKSNSSVLPERKDESSSEKFEDKYPSVPNQVQGASVPNSSGDAACQNAPAGAPVLPQQIGQGGTSDNNMPGSALSSLFRHVWSDPCLVFAFRTLMGDIPVLNDTLAYRSSAYDGNRSYFLPPQNLNKGAAPNWSSSAYDGNRNHTQVDHVSLSVPRPSDKFYGSGWFPPQ